MFQPFLAQAEQEKLEYESARKLYEEGTTGYSNSINFSILPPGGLNSVPWPSSFGAGAGGGAVMGVMSVKREEAGVRRGPIVLALPSEGSGWPMCGRRAEAEARWCGAWKSEE